MAPLFLISLILTTLLFLVALVSILSKSTKHYVNSKLPPGNTGWPLIGETLAFAFGPEKFVRSRMIKYSPDVFKTLIAGEKTVVLCGSSGNKFVFSNDTKLLTPWWPRSISQVLLFPLKPNEIEEDHSFLKLESMQKYVSVMDAMAREHLETNWVPYKEVRVHPLTKDFTFALAFRLFVNYNNFYHTRELAESFFAVAKGILSAPVNVPGTPFNRAVKGGALIREKLLEIIRQRRMEIEEGFKGNDLLSRLLVSSDGTGKILSEEVIANKIIGYLIASFYTTSNAITSMLSHLADHPDVYDNVLKEQQVIAKSKETLELLTWADIQKMKYSWNVVCESMRLTPPAQGAFKEVVTDFSYAGFDIPKGWKAFWSVHSTNKDPKYFPDPERFDPSRFEGSGPPPFTFAPFGGGPHMCAGKEYARIEILSFVHNVVTRFRFKKVNPKERITYNVEPIHADGLRISLLPHAK